MFDVRKIEKNTDPGKPFPFTCDGQQFEFPPALRAEWKFLYHVKQRELYEAISCLLSHEPVKVKGKPDKPSDYERFLALRLDFEDLNAILDAYIDHANTSRGESTASANSSSSTERPSKQTSPATTG